MPHLDEGRRLATPEGLWLAPKIAKRSLRVLVVEEGSPKGSAVWHSLHSRAPGAYTITRAPARAARAAFENGRHDVILLDGSLCDREELAPLQRQKDTPILVMTADTLHLGGGDELLLSGSIHEGSALECALRYVVEVSRGNKLEASLKELRRTVERAGEVQNLLLAGPRTDYRLDVCGAVYPATELSGDFHDVFALPDGRFVLALGDVTGHGFGPALLMTTARAYVRATFLGMPEASLETVLQRVNAMLVRDVGEDCFVALTVAVWDPRSRDLQFASAGLPPAYLLTGSGELRELVIPGNLPLGIEPAARFDSSGPISTSPGDVLVLITDGVLESGPDRCNLFGVERVIQTLLANRTRTAQQLVAALHFALLGHCGSSSFRDDVSMIVARLLR